MEESDRLILQIEGLNWQKLNLENQFYNGCKNQGTKLIFFPKDSYFCYKKEKEKKALLTWMRKGMLKNWRDYYK